MSKRSQKISSLIAQKLAELIHKNMADELGMVCVNFVDISADFRLARAYVSTVNGVITKEKLAILQSRAYEFQKEIGKVLFTKYTPIIEFKADTKQDSINRIDEILEKINHEY